MSSRNRPLFTRDHNESYRKAPDSHTRVGLDGRARPNHRGCHPRHRPPAGSLVTHPVRLQVGTSYCCEAIGQPPNAVPANPPAITRRLKGFKAAQLGLRPASWNNALSLARKAFRAAGCFVAPGAYNAPLTPAWAALAEKITNKAVRYGLSRFMHIASQHRWEAEDVSDDHFDRYEVELETRLACKNSPREAKRARQLWNQAAGAVPGWPSTTVRTANGPRGYCFPWSAFPGSLKGEVDTYCAKRSTNDLFAEKSAEPLSPRTLTDHEFKVR